MIGAGTLKRQKGCEMTPHPLQSRPENWPDRPNPSQSPLQQRRSENSARSGTDQSKRGRGRTPVLDKRLCRALPLPFPFPFPGPFPFPFPVPFPSPSPSPLPLPFSINPSAAHRKHLPRGLPPPCGSVRQGPARNLQTRHSPCTSAPVQRSMHPNAQ